MVALSELVHYCEERLEVHRWKDYPGACNGLQCANSGEVRKLGAAVDAGVMSFTKAAELGVDFLIVHHGMFWSPIHALTHSNYERVRLLIQNDMALYASHLPLDGHRELGNNVGIAAALGLEIQDWTGLEAQDIMALVSGGQRNDFRTKLKKAFPRGIVAMEFGPEELSTVGICSGSLGSLSPEDFLTFKKKGVHTFVTGEVKQSFFNMAHEAGLNLYLVGHYASEVFGVQALAKELADCFELPWEWIETNCPL